jgi:hypothetical protein
MIEELRGFQKTEWSAWDARHGRKSREVAVERDGSCRDTKRKSGNADIEKRRCAPTAWQAGDQVRGPDCKKWAALGNIRRAVHHARAESSP